MRIILINLDRAKQRLKFQYQQFKSLGLEFERFEAISSDTLPLTINQKYWKTWQRPLSQGEKACLLSHRELWKKVKVGNEPILILEDDVYLAKDLAKILKDVEEKASNELMIDHLNLEVRERKKQISKNYTSLNNHHKIYKIIQDRTGAAAYILWPKGAEILLSMTEYKAGLADAVICSAYQLESYQIEPACAFQFDTSLYYGIEPPFPTNSATHESPKMDEVNFAQTVIYKLRRIKAQLSLGLRFLTHLTTTEKRHIRLEKSDF